MKLTKIRTLAVAGTFGLAGLGAGVALVPTVASAATSTTSAVSGRATAIKDALSGLVKDGTISQAQADKVASTLDTTLPEHGFGGHAGFGRGANLDSAASVIGVTTDELRTQLQAGKTLAQIAESKGISQTTLVDKLVAAEKTRIAAAVKAGTITQAQADKRLADLNTRITQQVTSSRQFRGDHGRGGPRGSDSGTGSTPSASPSASTTG